MIQRTPLLSLCCVTLIAMAACSASSVTPSAPVANAQQDGDRSTQSATPPPLVLTQSTTTLDAVVGTTTQYACAFQIASYSATYPYTLTDWGLGTTVSGAGTFPIWNYPPASALSWSIAGVSTAEHAVANSGSPGETVLTGTAGGLGQTHCVNLAVTVPGTQPTGTYSASIQYTLLERVGFIGVAVTHQAVTFTVLVRDR